MGDEEAAAPASDWDRRDLPLLEAFATAERAGAKMLSTQALATSLGLGERDVWTGCQALRDAGYVTWGQVAASAFNRVIYGPSLREKGRRTVGAWPQDGSAALVALLEARIASEADVDRRGRLERLRDGLLGVGRDVATDLLTAWLRGQAGL